MAMNTKRARDRRKLTDNATVKEYAGSEMFRKIAQNRLGVKDAAESAEQSGPRQIRNRKGGPPFTR
jgi:hypothetical protein